jgi:RNA polymerase sigma-70 factor (ECF subfamily)
MNQASIKPILLTNFPDTILKGCQRGDLHSQEQLYRHCYSNMIKICYRYARDMDGAGIIFNNAMLRVFRGINNYKEEGKLMGWIKKIVTNCCIDFVKTQTKFQEEAHDNFEDHEIAISAEALSFVCAKEIHETIRQLPRATSTVFNLYVYEGFTHKEIAVSLGITEGTSKWHVSEGRRLLRTKLKNFINP